MKDKETKFLYAFRIRGLGLVLGRDLESFWVMGSI